MPIGVLMPQDAWSITTQTNPRLRADPLAAYTLRTRRFGLGEVSGETRSADMVARGRRTDTGVRPCILALL